MRAVGIALMGIAISIALAAAPGSARAGNSAPDLSGLPAAVGLYVQSHGSTDRGDCGSVASTVVSGTCYQSTPRADDNVEIWLTDLATNASSLLLFSKGDSGWYPFTRPIQVTSHGPGVNAFAEWSDLMGRWTANGRLAGSGYPGIGYGVVNNDGSGGISAGRFDVARLQLNSPQDGIAVGTITFVEDNVDPSTQAITGTTDLSSSPCAFVLLDDGSAVLTSSGYPQNLPVSRSP